MPTYDFRSLSPQDFEEITRDLLQAEWGVAIEAFKTGRDRGIDLRYAKPGSAATIVQCKHYAGSTISKLLGHLQDDELSKVKLLRPDRYVVVTSLGLTPAAKDKVVAVMSPFIKSTADVFGLSDLNGLLARHPQIERRNFKLWLTNTEVVSRILHNAEVCHTQFEVERIRLKLPKFVQSAAYPRAREILDGNRILIVSGIPGIGKTTLAEMLLYAHLDDGYEPVVVQTEIAEGKRFFRSNHKQIFYYDDFLGQTFLGDQRSYVARNHDAALLAFMAMVRQTPNSRFILTTREHILRQALQVSERLHQSAALNYKCVLELGDYSLGQRARILYNHLFFSDLSIDHKKAMLQDDFYWKIIRHKQFNPRLIEWLTALTRLNSPTPAMYQSAVSKLLEAPEQIWAHAFHTQISNAARDLLLALYSLGEWCDIKQLEISFEAIHAGASERHSRARSASDFRAALQEVDGGFLSYSFGRASFINPSVREFTAWILSDTPSLALEIISDAAKFRQILNIWVLTKKPENHAFRASILGHCAVFLKSTERILQGDAARSEKAPQESYGQSIDTSCEGKLDALVEWCEAFKDPTFIDLAHRYAGLLIKEWGKRGVGFGGATKALATLENCGWFMQNGGSALYRDVLNAMLAHLDSALSDDWSALLKLPEILSDWTEADQRTLSAALKRYQVNGVDEERDSCSDASDLGELNSNLRQLEEQHSLSFTRTIASIDLQISELEERQGLRDEEEGGGGFLVWVDPRFRIQLLRPMFERCSRTFFVERSNVELPSLVSFPSQCRFLLQKT
jgi:hypothetical protein